MKFYIKEARERVGLSQKELAELLGIKPTTFNGYETGTHDPKSEILVKIAIQCNTSVDYLLGCTNDPSPPKTKKAPAQGESDFKKKRLIHNYDKLNELGQDTLVTYSDDIASMPKYTDEPHEAKKQA